MGGQWWADDPDPVTAQLDHAANQFAALRTIIQGARAMAFADKMSTLADRLSTVNGMHRRADMVTDRLLALSDRGDKTFSGLEDVVLDLEKGVDTGAALLSKLTNGPAA